VGQVRVQAPQPASLADQQAWFVRAVMTPESEADPEGAEHAEALLTPGPQLGALDRLEIYRRAYHARLIECLLDDYPAMAAVLGEIAFETLCRDYIARYPSGGPSLNAFGRHMSALCRDVRAAPTPLWAFCAELAELEWAIVEVIHAAAAPPLTMSALAAVPAKRWPEAVLGPTPALRLLHTRYPVNRYYQAFREGAAPPVPPAEASTVAVYRSGATVWRMDLGPPAAALLEALASGKSLGAALEEGAAQLGGRSESEAAATVSRWFQDWVASGLFCAVEVP
jgi:hypothetical protein